MKAVITKSFISRDLIPYIPYIAHIFRKQVYKHHCMKCAACGHHYNTAERHATRCKHHYHVKNTTLHSPEPPPPLPKSTADLGYQLPYAESGSVEVEVESQVSAKGCYNDAQNSSRASRQCCNVPTCHTLHAVVFIHPFSKYMSDIWNIWDLCLSDK